MRLSINLRALALAILSASLITTASAAEVRVMISGGLTAAFKALVPEFERTTGNTVSIAYGPSMGTTTKRHSGAAGARRTRRCPDHGRLCARRSGQARARSRPAARSNW